MNGLAGARWSGRERCLRGRARCRCCSRLWRNRGSGRRCSVGTSAGALNATFLGLPCRSARGVGSRGAARPVAPDGPQGRVLVLGRSGAANGGRRVRGGRRRVARSTPARSATRSIRRSPGGAGSATTSRTVTSMRWRSRRRTRRPAARWCGWRAASREVPAAVRCPNSTSRRASSTTPRLRGSASSTCSHRRRFRSSSLRSRSRTVRRPTGSSDGGLRLNTPDQAGDQARCDTGRDRRDRPGHPRLHTSPTAVRRARRRRSRLHALQAALGDPLIEDMWRLAGINTLLGPARRAGKSQIEYLFVGRTPEGSSVDEPPRPPRNWASAS